jgi:hypothetical protein
MLVSGKLERFAAAGGAINVLVDTIGSISAPDRPLAQIKDFSMLDEAVRRGRAEQDAREAEGSGATAREATAREAAAREAGASEAAASEGTEAEDFRAVAPAVMSFGSGRRR